MFQKFKYIGYHNIIVSALVFCYMLAVFERVSADDSPGEVFLSTEEITGISLVSAGVFGAGMLIRRVEPEQNSLLNGPILFDRAVQMSLGGRFSPGKSNLWDKKFGNLYTTAGCGLILFAADLTWPRYDKNKETLQDMFLYNTGLMATIGVTGLFKGTFARPRPYMEYINEPSDKYPNRSYNRQSFISGHTSSAFFSVTFLNKRLRAIMRNKMSVSDYRNWRWLSPAALYGWSALVGWSRIHAYQHYPTDVVMGAVVGYLIAELFYSFSDYFENVPENNIGEKTIFRFTLTF